MDLNGKILLLAYTCSPNKGSEPGYGWNYLIEYSKRCKTVFLLTRYYDSDQLEDSCSAIGLTNVHVIRLKIPYFDRIYKIKPFGQHLHYMLWQRVAKRFLSRKQFDVDFAHHVTYGNLLLGSALSASNIPFIFGPVGGGQFMNPVFKPYLKKNYYFEIFRSYFAKQLGLINTLFDETLNKASLILLSNRESLEFISKRKVDPKILEKCKLELDTGISNMYLPEDLPPKRKSRTFELLWTGRMLPRKGLEILLEIVALVDKSIPFKLTIVGAGPVEEKVRKMIKSLDLENRVLLTGLIPYGDVKELYKEADVFLFTSYRDSVGVQILEALGHGLPVITFDQFGASILVNEDVGFKIQIDKSDLNNTKKDFAHKIEALYRDSSLYSQLSANAFSYAKGFKWQKKLDNILVVFKGIQKKRLNRSEDDWKNLDGNL